MAFTSLRDILTKKGFCFENFVMDWQLKSERTYFFKEKLSPNPHRNKYNDYILDLRFDDSNPHPIIKFVEVRNNSMTISICFNTEKEFKMLVASEFHPQEGEFSFDDVFKI